MMSKLKSVTGINNNEISYLRLYLYNFDNHLNVFAKNIEKIGKSNIINFNEKKVATYSELKKLYSEIEFDNLLLV